MACSASLDHAFGPRVAQCRRALDFTLYFENVILTIVPNAIFLVMSILRVKMLAKRDRRVAGRGRYLLYIKLFLGLSFACLQVVQLAVLKTASVCRATSYAATACVLVASFSVCILSTLEHQRSVRPSALLECYLLFNTVVDMFRSRTIWLTPESGYSAAVFTTAMVLRAIQLLTESPSKKRYLGILDRLHPREDVVGFWNRTVFAWLLELLGFAYSHILTIDDIYTLRADLATSKVQSQFSHQWQQSLRSEKKPRQHLLIWVVAKSFKNRFLWPIIPRLCLTGFTFAQPFLVTSILNFLEASPDGREPSSGYGLLIAYIFVATGVAFSTAWYWSLLNRSIIAVRGTLISTIYLNAMNLPAASAADDSVSSTLMSADVERIAVGMRYMHESWASLVDTAIATYLLQRQVGLPSLSMVGLAILCAITATWLGKMAGKQQRLWVEATQQRLKMTSALLKSIKSVKMMGLEQIMSKSIQDLRQNEIKSAQGFRGIERLCVVLSYVTIAISPVLVFSTATAVALLNKTSFDPTTIFTSLTLIQLLATPLLHLLQEFPSLYSAIACFDRIESFLLREKRIERDLPVTSRPIQILQNETNSQNPGPADGAITDDSRSSWRGPESSVAIELSVLPVNAKPIFNVRDGNFSWREGIVPTLTKVDVQIMQGEVVMVTGPIGSGKTMFIYAVLGEVLCTHGLVELFDDSIALCEQRPYITNSTIRQNITGPLPYDERWYQRVLKACSIDEDIGKLVEGDQTKCGSSGNKLSGGQRQRIALARAVYARKRLILIDDGFSGLDRNMEGQVLSNLLGPLGLLREHNVTVIFASHGAHHLKYSDKVMSIGSDGEMLRFELSKDSQVFPNDNVLDDSRHTEVIDNISQESPMETSVQVTTTQPPADHIVYQYYIGSVGIINTLVFMLLIAIFAFFYSFPGLWLKWWSESNGNRSNGYYLGIYAVFQAMILIAIYMFTWQLFSQIVPQSGSKLHQNLLHKTMHASFAQFSRIDIGTIMNRFTQDLYLVDGTLPLEGSNTLSESFIAIFQIGLVAAANPILCSTFVPLAACFYFLQKFYLRTSKQLRILDLEARAPLYSHFMDTVTGLVTVRAFHWQTSESEKNQRLTDQSQRPYYLMLTIQRWLTLVLNLLVGAFGTALVGIAVGLQGKVGSASMGVALVNLFSLTESLQYTIISWTGLETALGAIARIIQYEQQTPSEVDPKTDTVLDLAWPQRGRVEFRNISISYGDVSALNNINFVIEAGQKVAICGRSGSGKSSLVAALCRLLPPVSGSIAIDGIDIAQLPLDWTRSRMSVLPQDPFLLPWSIRSNLDPHGNGFDELLARTLLQDLGLWSMIDSVGGLDANLDSETWSMGQRQLLCLARAILTTGSPIFIMDESTSSLDSETERLVYDAVDHHLKNTTVISVVHRIEFIDRFDRVAVFDQGNLIAFVTPVEFKRDFLTYGPEVA